MIYMYPLTQAAHFLLLLWVILTSGLGMRLDLHVMTHLYSLCGWGGLLEKTGLYSGGREGEGREGKKKGRKGRR